MNVKYQVHLTQTEREHLSQMLKLEKLAGYKRRRAQILLKADESTEGIAWNDQQIKKAFDMSILTINRVSKSFVEKGFEYTMTRKIIEPRRKKLDGEVSEQMLTLAVSSPPAGRAEWSLRLLADQLVELEYVESVSHETVRQQLKKKDQAPFD